MSLTRRQHVPRIDYFVERVIPRCNLDDFRVHFRISRDTFDEILYLVKSDLMPELERGREAKKTVNIIVLYGKHGNEIGHYFGVCKASMFHIIKIVSNAIIGNLSDVSLWPKILIQYISTSHSFLYFFLKRYIVFT